MSTQEFRFDPSQILSPAFPSPLNRLSPAKFGPSLTVTRGQAMARKSADGKFYPLNTSASDGTQTFAGFAQYSGSTDSSSNFYLSYGTNAGDNFFSPPFSSNNIYTGGIFDPNELTTGPATGSETAEVDTITPAGTITTGDVNIITLPDGATVQFAVAGTTTAAAVVTGLTNAWNANPVAKALATPSGSGTLILTATNPGNPMNLQTSVNGVGTLTKVITTPSSDAQQSEVDTFTPAGSITTGDVYTLTSTLPNTTATSVSFTVGATTTAAAVSAGLIAAWNANTTLANLATASGSSTVVLTAVVPGNILSITGSVVGVGTISKAVTTPAAGRNLADILPGNPGAHILQPTGYWELP